MNTSMTKMLYIQTHTYIYIYNEILCSHRKNTVLICVTMWINLENIKLNKPDIGGETLYDSTQMDYIEDANSQGQKVHQKFPRAEGKGEWELLLNGYIVSV